MTTNPTDPDFQRRVREALLDCADLRYQSLRALFVDQRIAPWRNGLPQTDSNQAQAQAMIGYLYKQNRADTGENALKLFLQVLSDHFDPMDNCHQQFKVLAAELDAPTSPKITNPEPPVTKTLSFDPSKKFQLIDLLLACGTMSNFNDRNAVVADLPSEISSNIKRSDGTKMDVRNIVDTCLKYPNGLNELVKIIRYYEGGSTAMQQLAEFLG